MRDLVLVRDAMVDPVVTVPVDATAMDAATRMRDRDVSSVVVTRDGEPVGILTEGDFVTLACERTDLSTVAVESVMSSPLVTARPDDPIGDAATTLRANDVEHLPVVAGDEPAESDADDGLTGSLVGIVTAIELSYYVPQLVRPAGETADERPRRRVRTDTLYERDEWSFEYRGEDERQVSVGDVARFSKVLSSADVESFAEATGDTNRVHLDADYAAETRFGERIVHGVLATGLISAALARLPGLTIYLSQEASFRGPIAVGERATAVCEVIDDLGGAKYRIATTVYDGADDPVLEGEAVVLVDEVPAVADAGPAE